MSITNSVFRACETSGNPNSFMRFNFKTDFSFEFENNTISKFTINSPSSSILSINTDGLVDKLEFRNVTFEDNICDSFYGGGEVLFTIDNTKVSFHGCHFKNNSFESSKNLFTNSDEINSLSNKELSDDAQDNKILDENIDGENSK